MCLSVLLAESRPFSRSMRSLSIYSTENNVYQYEIIHNPQTVDLLVSIAHSAASEGVIDEPLPIGMALRVPLPVISKVLLPATLPYPFPGSPQPQPTEPSNAVMGPDGLCDFDDLNLQQVSTNFLVRCSVYKVCHR